MKTQKLKNIVLIFCFALLTLSFQSAYAQKKDGEQESKYANAKTTKVKAMSQKLAKQLESVRACLAPEAEEGQTAPEPDGRCAVKGLDKIKKDKLPGHEKAELWNLYGYAYYILEDQNNTKKFYTRVINEPEANAPLRNRTLKTVAQLHLIDEEYQKALEFFLQWMSVQQVLGPADFALLATIYYNVDDQDNSLKNIEIAIAMREDKGEIGQENWYSVQRSIYYQRNDFRKVIEIVKKLIINYPNVRYWRELGGMYAELEDTEKQHAAYDLAYLQNGLTSESQLVGLAYMYIGADAPWKASQIIIKGFEEGTIEESEKNLQIVGSALYQASELEKALPWMEKAASKASDGESYARLAGIYVDLERYSDAVRTASEAIDRKGVKRLDLAYMTKGNAEFNLKRYDASIRSFKQIKDPRSTKSAKQWIKYVESERKRDQQLRDSGIDLDKILASR